MCKYKSIESLLEETIASDATWMANISCWCYTRLSMLQFFNGIRLLLWRRLELSRVSSVPRAIVYQPSIRQQAVSFLLCPASHSWNCTAAARCAISSWQNWASPLLCQVTEYCFANLEAWNCNGIPYQKQSPVLYDVKLCSMEILYSRYCLL